MKTAIVLVLVKCEKFPLFCRASTSWNGNFLLLLGIYNGAQTLSGYTIMRGFVPGDKSLKCYTKGLVPGALSQK